MRNVSVTATLLCIFLFSSCRTLEKSLAYGNYEQVIDIALSKYSRGKLTNEHKAVLSKAYRALTNTEFEKIAALKNQRESANWPEIYSRYCTINRLQEKLRPILPVRFSNGKEANIELYNISAVLEESKINAADFYYARGLGLMQQDSKLAARDALVNFEKVRRYFNSYKDIDQRVREAYQKGSNHIGIKTVANNSLFLAPGFEKELLPYRLDQLNQQWLQFDLLNVQEDKYDYLIQIQLTEAIDGPPVTNQRNWTETKKIKDGFNYVLDENGNVKKDSLGNDVRTNRYIDIVAYLTSFEQVKSVRLSARIDFIRISDGRLVERIPVSHDVIFNNIYATVHGNLNAVSENTRQLLHSRSLPFPPASTMYLEAQDILREKILDVLDNEHHLLSRVD